MANKALNQVSQVQSTELANVKTFLAVMNNGEIKQMSKEDMAAVVGGLLPVADWNETGLMQSNVRQSKVTKQLSQIDECVTVLDNPSKTFCGFIAYTNPDLTAAYALYYYTYGRLTELVPEIYSYALSLEVKDGNIVIRNTQNSSRKVTYVLLNLI